MLIEKLFLVATHGDAASTLLIILVLFGVIDGLCAALLIYYMDQWYERKRNCAWCNRNRSTLGGICFKHARLLTRQSAHLRRARLQMKKTPAAS